MTPGAMLPSCGAPPSPLTHCRCRQALNHSCTITLIIWKVGITTEPSAEVCSERKFTEGKFVIILVIVTGIIPLFGWDGKLLGDLKRA